MDVMHCPLIIMSTKCGLLTKKCWIMQYPSVFQRGKGGLCKMVESGQEVRVINVEYLQGYKEQLYFPQLRNGPR